VLKSGPANEIEEEIGDLLFAVVNLSPSPQERHETLSAKRPRGSSKSLFSTGGEEGSGGGRKAPPRGGHSRRWKPSGCGEGRGALARAPVDALLQVMRPDRLRTIPGLDREGADPGAIRDEST